MRTHSTEPPVHNELISPGREVAVTTIAHWSQQTAGSNGKKYDILDGIISTGIPPAARVSAKRKLAGERPMGARENVKLSRRT
jgi:hypothetical protein